jgi:hypothetical protein
MVPICALIEEENSTVLFKGALPLTGTEDDAAMLDMLKETLIGPATPMLDLRELDFLNSSGITMLARFVIELVTMPESTFRCSLLNQCRGLLVKEPSAAHAHLEYPSDLTYLTNCTSQQTNVFCHSPNRG